MRVLAWPVDVGVAQGDIGDAVLDAIEIQIVLPSPLAHPVGTDGAGRVLLAGRKGFLFAVDRPARRSEDDSFDTGLACAFESIEQPKQGDPRVKEWADHRAAHL